MDFGARKRGEQGEAGTAGGLEVALAAARRPRGSRDAARPWHRKLLQALGAEQALGADQAMGAEQALQGTNQEGRSPSPRSREARP